MGSGGGRGRRGEGEGVRDGGGCGSRDGGSRVEVKKATNCGIIDDFSRCGNFSRKRIYILENCHFKIRLVWDCTGCGCGWVWA